MPVTPVKFTVVIGFKSAHKRGPATIKLVPTDPNGTLIQSFEFHANFEGDDDRGAMLIVEMEFPLQVAGVYWFDVRLDEELITRMPLRAVYQRGVQIQSAG
jgi:hypothetical protein